MYMLYWRVTWRTRNGLSLKCSITLAWSNFSLVGVPASRRSGSTKNTPLEEHNRGTPKAFRLNNFWCKKKKPSGNQFLTFEGSHMDKSWRNNKNTTCCFGRVGTITLVAGHKLQGVFSILMKLYIHKIQTKTINQKRNITNKYILSPLLFFQAE